MERNRRTVESDIRKFYSESGQILNQVSYLKEFFAKDESWDMCMSILVKHSSFPEKITKSTVTVLMYCASTLKFHAYEGFRAQFKGFIVNKYRVLWEICDKILDLLFAYSVTHPQIGSDLAAVAACAVIYGFETTHRPSEILFLIALSKTSDGTISQYLYLSSVAREALGKNISIHLNHRCSFLRLCLAFAPKIFTKLVEKSQEDDISADQYRILAVLDWLHMHIYLLRFFYPVLIETKFLEACELVFEETMLPSKRISDLTMVHMSLESIIEADVADMIFRFLKYSIASENAEIMHSSTELSLYMLYMCQVDLSGLLIMTSNTYQELITIPNHIRWNEASKETLSKSSRMIIQFTTDFVLGICKLASSLLICAEPDRKLRFLKEETSKCLIEIFKGMAEEHLPLVLHFGLVKNHHVQNICRFIDLYLYSDIYKFRKGCLDFWRAFQNHLCPNRRELSFVNSSLIEKMRDRIVCTVLPCFEHHVKELYNSILISDWDNFEQVSLYRGLVIRAIRDSSVVTGIDYFLKFIRQDLDLLVRDFNLQVVERCIFVSSILASRLVGAKDVIKSVILIALELIDLKKIKPTKKQPSNFYRNSVFSLILWSSGLVVKDNELLNKTAQILEDQMTMTKSSNIPLNAHVRLDHCLMSLCFSLNLHHPLRKTLIKHLTLNISNYVSPLDKRLEIVESFMTIIDTFPNVDAVQIRYSITKAFFYQICHISQLKEMAESYLFIMAAMCSVNFTNHKELTFDFVEYIVEFIHSFKIDEELWTSISDIICFVSFHDMSQGNFYSNTIMNNKTSFLYWLFATSEPIFPQLCLIKTLFKRNMIKHCTPLFDHILKTIVALCREYVELIRRGVPPPDHHTIDLLDTLSLIFIRSEMVKKFLEWKDLGEFISVMANSLPAKLANLNFSGFSVIAKFSAWAEIPKQLITNIDPVKYQRFKFIKTKVRITLNKKDKDSKFYSVLYNIIDAIFKAVVIRADQMDTWIIFASQALSVLIKCTQTLDNTQIVLKNVMNDRCLDLSQAHINFYLRKLLQAKSSTDIRYLLRIISDYHNCKFTLY